MDYINTNNFEIRRDRNIPDKTNWIPYKWNDNGIQTLTLPTGSSKYWKYDGSTIKKMTTAEKKVVDDNEALFIFNNRTKIQIFSDIRKDFEAQGKLMLIANLLNNYGAFTAGVESKDFDFARMIVDSIPLEELSIEDAVTIKSHLPL